jgi:hypothetical protein
LEELKQVYREWSAFTETRELERSRLMNPEGAKELRELIDKKKSEVLQAQAELQILQARLVLSRAGEVPYRKADFDHEWSRKKAVIKAERDRLAAEQIEQGVSIPKIMKELNTNSPNWLYAVRDNINAHRGAAKEDLTQTDWKWTNVTSVHRYAVGHDLKTNEWAFVMLKGVIDTPMEGDYCTFDFKTGNFISGSREVFDSVTPSVKKQRSQMLADLLDGTYTKSVKRDNNPYFQFQD